MQRENGSNDIHAALFCCVFFGLSLVYFNKALNRTT